MTVSPAELSQQLLAAETSAGLAWWWTQRFEAVRRQHLSDPLVVALSGLADMLRGGQDPDWVAGGTSAQAAVREAVEWLDAGVEPALIADWLRAGCHRPHCAVEMTEAGIHPRQLLDDRGRPRHVVEAPNGWPNPLALAVADGDVTVAEARQIIDQVAH